MWLTWLYYLSLLLVQVLGVALTLVGLPGLWLMVGALALYAWVTGFNIYVGWPSMVALLVLAALAEVVETGAGAAGAKQAGGSKRGMIGAVVGGFVGAIVLTPVIPIPVVGTVAGLCIGSFGGAFLVEAAIGKEMGQSATIGWGAAKGRFWGTVFKVCFGIVMLIVAMLCALPL